MGSPFFDSSLPVEERIDWLLQNMTIEEKLSCMASRAPELGRLGVRAFSVGGEAAHGVEARNDQNGLNVAEPTTSFPQPIGMSASWDPELLRRAGEAVGVEARVLYHRHPDRGLSRWAPTVDLERDPRWGRTEEGYGEDPLLTGAMASAYIRGMQGDDPAHLRVAATLKHFYANNTEQGRGWKSASIDPRNRMELYLEPFRRCIQDGGAEAIMTAYNKINGVPGILNPEVKHILKEQYGLHHAVCDGGAMELVREMHQYFGTHAETLAAAVKAGVDAMSDNPRVVEQAAREAYELHLISEEEIDGALRNMFRTKLRLGIYDEVPVNPYDQVTEEDLCCARHQKISRQLARESVVLLKNDGILPLAKDAFRPSADNQKKLALIGPLADQWYQDWYGGEPPYRTTLRDGIAAVCSCAVPFCDVTDGSCEASSCDGADGSCEVPFCDGEDRVIFRYGDGGITVTEDESLRITDHPDVFVKQEWGEGRTTFYSLRTGKYLNLVLAPPADGQAPDRLELRANSKAPFSWFVTEIFHVHPTEDGQITLTTRMDTPVVVEADGSVVSRAAAADTAAAATATGVTAADTDAAAPVTGAPAAAYFHMEIVESGAAKARALAKESDVVVLALGCSPMVCAKEEIDRGTICLPPAQEALMKAVCAENPNTVLVLFSNYPYAINWAEEHVPAILWSATGSQDMGTAMADTLFGESAPAGRLNMTWYRSDDDLPDIDDYDIIRGGRTYRYFEGDVLYPFGHGLTYTEFAYGNLKAELKDKEHLLVTAAVTNTGNTQSDEVVQVYGAAPASRVKKPRRQLLGFRRLKDIRPGETRTAELVIPVRELGFYDVISDKWMVEEGRYRIFAGRSSADLPLETQLWIPGERTGLRDLAKRVPADHYDDCEQILLTEGHFGYTAAARAETVRAPRIQTPACDPAQAQAPQSCDPAQAQAPQLCAPAPTQTPQSQNPAGHEAARPGRLVYRDCRCPEGKTLVLYMRSDCGGRLEVRLDGRIAGTWEGDTRVSRQRGPIDNRTRAEAAYLNSVRRPVWTDVRIDLADPDGSAAKNTEAPVTLELCLTGDIRLCYFRTE